MPLLRWKLNSERRAFSLPFGLRPNLATVSLYDLLRNEKAVAGKLLKDDRFSVD